jgi:sulfur carrier protein
LNGEKFETSAKTLTDLCSSLGYGENAKIATAVNGDFVPATARKTYDIAIDDEIEIVAPRQGG